MSKLDTIVQEIQNYKRDKETLYKYYISNRLNQSLTIYNKEMTDSFNYLKHKNELKVVRKLNSYGETRK